MPTAVQQVCNDTPASTRACAVHVAPPGKPRIPEAAHFQCCRGQVGEAAVHVLQEECDKKVRTDMRVIVL